MGSMKNLLSFLTFFASKAADLYETLATPGGGIIIFLSIS